MVSVVVPTRGRPDFLARALESVLEQTYRPIEVVVVDENDVVGENKIKTGKIVEDIRDRARVAGVPLQYLGDRDPGGACKARNDGAAVSHGSLLAFLDDDDFWRPRKIQSQVEALEDAGPETALIYTGREIVDTAENRVKCWYPTYRGWILEDLLVKNVINTLSSVLIRRNVFEEISGFDPAFPSRQDLDLFIRVARAYRIDFVPQPLTVYTNLFNDSISKDYAKKVKGRKLILNKYADLYEGRPGLQSRYYYGSAKLSLKHHDYSGAVAWLRSSLKAQFSFRSFGRLFLTLIRHPSALIQKTERPN
ncbi:MAG: glycosyltransferase family 2 protein [Spirochaetaceae bacterium]|nr:glycosyltransferase family 2 protein [Spirochaetaceae bacterium]MCF7949360.1 glycosyltransferase family 2 protein [Spirochaetia bacterium]